MMRRTGKKLLPQHSRSGRWNVSHPEQMDFCRRISSRWPHLFQGKRVIDCGSLDINGNNRYLFSGCEYTGIDIVAGANVDVVTRIHEFNRGKFDVVISTECFEHDEHFGSPLLNHEFYYVVDDGRFHG